MGGFIGASRAQLGHGRRGSTVRPGDARVDAWRPSHGAAHVVARVLGSRGGQGARLGGLRALSRSGAASAVAGIGAGSKGEKRRRGRAASRGRGKRHRGAADVRAPVSERGERERGGGGAGLSLAGRGVPSRNGPMEWAERVRG